MLLLLPHTARCGQNNFKTDSHDPRVILLTYLFSNGTLITPEILRGRSLPNPGFREKET